jgi:Pyruvate/2-oxoacid:ferredoxin oxidoreductase gamma subunit
VLDPVLLATIDVTAGLRPGGWILVNSSKAPDALALSPTFGVATIDATGIALRHGLGSRTTPKVNTAIVGAFAALTGLVRLDSVIESMPDYVPIKVDANQAAARDAFEQVLRKPAEPVTAMVATR